MECPAKGLTKGEDSLMNRTDVIAISSVVVIILYWIVTLIVPTIVSPVVTLYHLLIEIALAMGYTGDFFVCLVGNATVLVPFPYLSIPFVLGGLTDSSGAYLFDPYLVGIVGGTGALIGEMTGYLAGYVGGELVEEDRRSVLREMAEAHPWATPVILWLLAVTPLPDDVLIVPLGVSRYSWWRVVIPQFVGKTMFITAVAIAGRLGLSWADQLVGTVASGGVVGRSIEAMGLITLVVVIYLLVSRDWMPQTR